MQINRKEQLPSCVRTVHVNAYTTTPHVHTTTLEKTTQRNHTHHHSIHHAGAISSLRPTTAPIPTHNRTLPTQLALCLLVGLADEEGHPELTHKGHDHLCLHLHDVFGRQEHARADLARARDCVLGVEHVVLGAVRAVECKGEEI